MAQHYFFVLLLNLIYHRRYFPLHHRNDVSTTTCLRQLNPSILNTDNSASIVYEPSTPDTASQKTMSASTLHNHGTRLLSLPAEIRNMIWRCTLLEEACLNINTTMDILAAPTRVCTQIYSEAAPIYFSEQAFGLKCYDYQMTAHQHFEKRLRKYCRENPVSTASHPSDNL